MNLRRLLFNSVLASAVVLLTACQPTAWRDSYAVSYLEVISGRNPIAHIRYVQDGVWREAEAFQVHGPTGNYGVALARRDRDPRTVFGYAHGNQMRVFASLGLAGFGGRPADEELTGAVSPPAVTHISGDEWMVGHTLSGGTAIEIRPYLMTAPGGLGAPVTLAGVVKNDDVAGRPAIAYHNGRLVLVWGRVADNRAFRFVAADYQAGSSSITVVQQGDVPGLVGNPVAEFQSSPALAHDGIGTFYLATVYRSGLTGLTQDFVAVYRSPDGQTWTPLSRTYPNNPTFLTAQTQVGIAALPSGEVLLAIISGTSKQMFRLTNGAWVDAGPTFTNGAFPRPPSPHSALALIRNQHLTTLSQR